MNKNVIMITISKEKYDELINNHETLEKAGVEKYERLKKRLMESLSDREIKVRQERDALELDKKRLMDAGMVKTIKVTKRYSSDYSCQIVQKVEYSPGCSTIKDLEDKVAEFEKMSISRFIRNKYKKRRTR